MDLHGQGDLGGASQVNKHPEIGSRQTVDRAKHPTLGEGRLVHQNGPAFFLADSGEWCSLTNVRWGGWSAARDGKPERSYHRASQDGSPIELEITGRERGDTHRRIFSPMIGAAWLVNLGVAPERRAIANVEPDGGKPFEIVWYQWWVGLPEHGGEKQSKKMDAERKAAGDAGWQCYKGDFGTFAFCLEEEAGNARHYLEHRNDPKPETPKRGKRTAPSGPMPDFAGMTREQVKAWQEGAR